MAPTNHKPDSVDDYIKTFPDHVQVILEQMRAAIQSEAPNAQETISYQMPTYKQNGVLVHFAGYKNHVGFYPTPSAIIAFKDELAQYQTSKGAIRFPLDEPLPLDLVRKIVAFRVRENSSR